MAMTMAMPVLTPATSGVQFTARPALRPASQVSQGQNVNSSAHSTDNSGKGKSAENDAVANPNLSSIEVESLLRDKVRSKYHHIQQGFQNYDTSQSLSVTKGEFRRVLHSYCLPLNTEQFEAVINKVDVNRNGTVKYCDFLDKFYGRDKHPERWQSGSQRYQKPQSPQDMNTDMIEKMIKEKIEENMKHIVKAFRLHDYNRDGQIQRHELRKVLENYCFKMTDTQFDKLYQRYDFQHKGVLNYREFLRNLGLNVENRNNKPPPDGLKGSLQWRDDTKFGPMMRKPEDARLANMTLDQIEIAKKKKVPTATLR